MDFDKAPPIAVSEYRKMRLVRASLDTFLGERARILIVGAGGGREIQTLAPSLMCYRFTAVDPSVAMQRVQPGADQCRRRYPLRGDDTGITALASLAHEADDGIG